MCAYTLRPGPLYAQKNKRSEMKGHEAREDMKRKRKRSVRRGKDEKGTKCGGREPMSPDLIATT